MKKYAVWGIDRSFRWLWLACLVAGVKASKDRWSAGKTK